jgi:hypothetical protein
MSNQCTAPQRAALLELALREEDVAAFVEGIMVVYYLPTESEPAVAVVQKSGARLRSGIVAIKDPGGGIKTLARFRGRSRAVAKAFQLRELELFGAAIINDRLELILARRFTPAQILCPDELGDAGYLDILTKVFEV